MLVRSSASLSWWVASAGGERCVNARCGFGSWHLTGGEGVAVWPGLQRASRLAFMSRVQRFSNDI